MDNLLKQRTAAWTIIILLIVNIATLSTIWYKEIKRPNFMPPGPQGRNDNVLHFLKEELELGDSQVRTYEKLRNNYLESSRIVFKEIQELKRSLIDEVFEDRPDSLKAAQIEQMIGEKQIELEHLTFSYFMDLKLLCGKEQKFKLQALMNEFFHRGRQDGPMPSPGNLPRRPPGGFPGKPPGNAPGEPRGSIPEK